MSVRKQGREGMIERGNDDYEIKARLTVTQVLIKQKAIDEGTMAAIFRIQK